MWTFSLERSPAERAALGRSLSDPEKARAARFASDDDRDHYLVGRATVRAVLSSLTGCPAAELVLDTEPASDKPRLASPPGMVFNLSHCDDTGLLAVGRAPGIRALGVDLERIRPDADIGALARRFFSAAERAELDTFPAPEERIRAFYAGWCRKEAVLKGIGTGLDLPLPDFDVQLRAPEAAPVTGRGELQSRVTKWLVGPLNLTERYCAALAVLR